MEGVRQSFLQRGDEVAVGAWEQSSCHFNDGHPGSECRIDRAHFQANVSASDDQQPLRDVFEFEGSGGVHYAIITDVKNRRHGGLRAGGDDAMVEAESF